METPHNTWGRDPACSLTYLPAAQTSRLSWIPIVVYALPLSPWFRRSKRSTPYPRRLDSAARSNSSRRDRFRPWQKMMTGFDASPGFHQPRSGIPSLEVNSTASTDRPTSSGVLGPRSGNRKRLFVIMREPPIGRTTKKKDTDQRKDAKQHAPPPTNNQ